MKGTSAQKKRQHWKMFQQRKTKTYRCRLCGEAAPRVGRGAHGQRACDRDRSRARRAVGARAAAEGEQRPAQELSGGGRCRKRRGRASGAAGGGRGSGAHLRSLDGSPHGRQEQRDASLAHTRIRNRGRGLLARDPREKGRAPERERERERDLEEEEKSWGSCVERRWQTSPEPSFFLLLVFEEKKSDGRAPLRCWRRKQRRRRCLRQAPDRTPGIRPYGVDKQHREQQQL